MTSFDLRPLTIGELLDRAFTLYRRHVTLFIGIMVPPSLVSLAMGLVFQVFPLSSLFGVNQPDDPSAAVSRMIGALLLLFVTMFVTSLVYATALGAATVAVADVLGGAAPAVRGSYARVRGRVKSLLWLSALTLLRPAGLAFAIAAPVGLVTALPTILWPASQLAAALSLLVFFVGVLVAMLAAWLLMMRYAVSVPALIVEGVPARDAIRRSVQLTKGYFGRVFLLALCVMVVTYTTALLLQAPFFIAARLVQPVGPAAFWLNVAATVCGALGSAVISPVAIVGFAVLYFDLRVRKEALDLHMMLSALGASADANAIASANVDANANVDADAAANAGQPVAP